MSVLTHAWSRQNGLCARIKRHLLAEGVATTDEIASALGADKRDVARSLSTMKRSGHVAGTSARPDSGRWINIWELT